MPSKLLINTQSTIGYNYKLQKATSEMKLGVNNTINSDTKSVGIKSMDGDKSKTKRLTGDSKVNTMVNKSSLEQKSSDDDYESSAETIRVNTNHEVTKVGVFIAVAVSAFVLWKVIR